MLHDVEKLWANRRRTNRSSRSCVKSIPTTMWCRAVVSADPDGVCRCRRGSRCDEITCCHCCRVFSACGRQWQDERVLFRDSRVEDMRVSVQYEEYYFLSDATGGDAVYPFSSLSYLKLYYLGLVTVLTVGGRTCRWDKHRDWTRVPPPNRQPVGRKALICLFSPRRCVRQVKMCGHV